MRGFLAVLFVSLFVPLFLVSGCSGRVQAGYDPNSIESRYGLTGGYVDKVSTENGMVDATIIPTTLADGRKVQLVIPHQPIDAEHQIFMRDGITITPIELANPAVKRQEFVESSDTRVIERRTTPPQPVTSPKKRSTKDEVLIVGGSAGAGAAIGALAGGKKGAAVGAASGGVAGLVYDLATKKK